MKSEPLVSVVVIFLNAGKFLQDAIESVLSQTFTNWELLLVDDGSTDTSTAIALEYVRQNPDQIHYLEHFGHRNRGMSASRNLGISRAKGRYIALLDADDVWLQRKLEEQVAVLDSHPGAAMVYGPGQWWYSWTGKPEDMNRDFMQRLWVPPDALIDPPALLTLFLRREEAVPLPSSILIRREAIRRIGGFEEVFRGMFEDQAFFAKVCLAMPAFADSRCWLRYRKHPNGCCAVAIKTGQTRSARLMFLRWLKGYLSKQGAAGGEVWTILKEELWRADPPLRYHLKMAARHPMRYMRKLLAVLNN